MQEATNTKQKKLMFTGDFWPVHSASFILTKFYISGAILQIDESTDRYTDIQIDRER